MNMNLNKKDTAKVVLLIWVGVSAIVWANLMFAEIHAQELGYNGSIRPDGSKDYTWYNHERLMLPWMFADALGGLGLWFMVTNIDSEREYQPEPTKEELEQIIELRTSNNTEGTKKEQL